MPLRGLNCLLAVKRRSETTDVVGGSSYTIPIVTSNIKCRIATPTPSQKQALEQAGYETLRMLQVVAQPSTLDVKENDIITITGGQYTGNDFLVRFVRRDSLLPTDSRSHVELLVEKYFEARSTP